MESFIQDFEGFHPIDWVNERAMTLGFNGSEINSVMIDNAVHNSCDFFGLPEPISTIQYAGYGPAAVFLNNPTINTDDAIVFSTYDIYFYGFNTPDAIELIMTHEAAHRVLQNGEYSFISDMWERELACDFFAGIRAGIQGIEIESFDNALENLPGCETHPNGALRSEILHHGKEISEQMIAQGIIPSIDNCMNELGNYLTIHAQDISNAKFNLGV